MENLENKISPDRIVLLAKQPGLTSFSSLFTIKHSLNTQKVGHTGTLDSFAQGLLVVCCGALTRLAGRITEFDKTYEAVIKFGEETDTLECTGNIIKTAPLPSEEDFYKAVKSFSGNLMQKPPLFSAIHVDGKRASDAVRSGKEIEIPCRSITVYKSEVLEVLKNDEGRVLASRVEFSVSKGTYIRSLARDIGEACGSAAHLAGLFRKTVGDFKIEDAAGFSLLKSFNIESALKNAEELKNKENFRMQVEKELQNQGIPKKNWRNDSRLAELNKENHQNEEILKKEVVEKARFLDKKVSSECGFGSLILLKGNEKWFRNGGKLSSSMFNVSPFSLTEDFASVFTEEGEFAGLLQKDEKGYFKYGFVNGDFYNS